MKVFTCHSLSCGSLIITTKFVDLFIARPALLKCVERDLPCITFCFVARVLVSFPIAVLEMLCDKLCWFKPVLLGSISIPLISIYQVGSPTFVSDYVLYYLLRRGLYKVRFIGSFRDDVRAGRGLCGIHLSGR